MINIDEEKSGLTGEVWGATFAHTYKVNSFFNPTIRRHDCLNSGYWYWLNLRQHPKDIIKYLRRKI